MLELDPKTTALVLIDLQKGIMGHELSPHSADQVTKVGSALADTFREAGAPVVLVNVGFAKDFNDVLRQPVDRPFAMPPGGSPENFSDRSQQRSMTGMINITGDWTRSLRSRVSAASVMLGGSVGFFMPRLLGLPPECSSWPATTTHPGYELRPSRQGNVSRSRVDTFRLPQRSPNT